MRIRTQSPGSDPLIGLTIHEFQIEKKLAEGGMGALYLARHRLMKSTLVVCKFLLPGYAKNPILRQRFYREAEAASKLKHEKILEVLNLGALDDGQLFIMVPYLDGRPLDAYLQSRGGVLSAHRAFHLVVQLCDALDYAHGLGIIHRDLKPENVYVVRTNSNPLTLKLLDFGIAKIVDAPESGPKTQRGIAMGTPGYMAVEQYERADEVTHLADVYSLAVMIWRIVTGRPPWPPSDPAVLRHLQRTQVPERPSTDIMPVKWADLLLAAMSVDPSARPQSVRELANALASALPAIGRLPSGAEILATMAPHFVRKAAPNVETVRNASDVDRIGPLLWSPGTASVAPPRVPTINERSAVDLDEATIEDRSAAERQAPLAAPFEPTINERSASDLEATIKERSAIDLEATIEERSAAARNVPPAALLEPTIQKRNAVDRDEAILNERSAAERHVPTAAPFEPTIKERSATDRRVPPPVPPASEGPTSRPNGWLTWWLTSHPNASSAPAEPSIVPLKGTSAGNARPPITRRAPTWIVLMVLIVAAVGGMVAFIYRSTDDSEHVQPISTHTKASGDAATKATKATKLNAIGGDP